MKTALKQAIEKIKDYPFLYTEDSIVSILTQLLEAEKEQIMKAYEAGTNVDLFNTWDILREDYAKEKSTEYYAKTFKSDE